MVLFCCWDSRRVVLVDRLSPMSGNDQGFEDLGGLDASGWTAPKTSSRQRIYVLECTAGNA